MKPGPALLAWEASERERLAMVTAMTFTEDECYELFLAVDSRVRSSGPMIKPEIVALREKLLPIYRKRHEPKA